MKILVRKFFLDDERLPSFVEREDIEEEEEGKESKGLSSTYYLVNTILLLKK